MPPRTLAANFFLKSRWPEDSVCPRYQGRENWPTTRDLLVCKACGHQASLTASTIFQDTRKPLTLWFRAMCWVTSQKNGASALGQAARERFLERFTVERMMAELTGIYERYARK